MPQFVEQEPPSGSPARKVSERAAATCVRFRPAARLWGCAIRKGRPRTMPGGGNCGPTTTRGSQTMMPGCSEKYFHEGCYD